MERPKNLIINADDFGLSHSVNKCILKAFHNGLITQVSLMAVGHAVDEAIEMALDYNIPCGIHLAIVCEFDTFPFKPLTSMPVSLASSKYFHNDLKAFIHNADPQEVEVELISQIEFLKGRGIKPLHFDSHIGTYKYDIIQKLSKTYNVINRDSFESGVSGQNVINTFFHLTIGNYLPIKLLRYKNYLSSISTGNHLVVCHPTDKNTEFENWFSSSSYYRKRWALENRTTDYECLENVSYSDLLDELSIKLSCFNYYVNET